MEDIRRRKARIEGEAEQRIALASGQAAVDRLCRLNERALPHARDEEWDRPKRLGRLPLFSHEELQQHRCARAGLGHVDMRIGAVGNQKIGHRHHLRRDIGV
jgi:hypothetical protein